MMLDPIGRLPKELIDATRAREAVAYIIASPWDSTTKVRVLKGWAVRTGVQFAPSTLARVEKSGLDA
jgi:hypothetical protein